MLLFCYGIFRRGDECDPDWQYLGPRTVPDHTIYQRVYNGTPNGIAYARPRTGGSINGDLYEVPDRIVLTSIDRTEGHPTWYARTPVVTSEGERCQMYVLQENVEDYEGYVDAGSDWVRPRW